MSLDFLGYECGAGRETRTPDHLITNQMLYQLSYAGTDFCYKLNFIKLQAFFLQKELLLCFPY
jgi:hypothetical protein